MTRTITITSMIVAVLALLIALQSPVLARDQVVRPQLPAHLDINGQMWDLVPVDHFDGDPDQYGSTDCDNREIDYLSSSDAAELREALWHEVFHAGACIHGGDTWWNSIHPTDDVHPGIVNLADFMHNFMHDNKQFVEWAEED